MFIALTWRRHSWPTFVFLYHFSDVIMSSMASEITDVYVVYSTACSGADQRKHQSSALQAFVMGILPATNEFPAQRASNAENVSIWLRHHALAALDIVSEAFQPLNELPPGRLAETVLVLTTDFGLILYETKNCEVFIHMRGEYIHNVCTCFHPCRAGTELIWSNIIKYHGCWCLAPSVARTSAPMILIMQIR